MTADPNQQYIGFVSSLHEGRIAIVTDVGWDAVDDDVATDERDRGVRQNRVVLTPDAGVKLVKLTLPRATVARELRLTGESAP